MDDEEMFNNHDMKIQNMLRMGGRGEYYVVEDVVTMMRGPGGFMGGMMGMMMGDDY